MKLVVEAALSQCFLVGRGSGIERLFAREDVFDSLLLMASGMPRSTEGGWLLWWVTYNGMLPGFIYGLYDEDLRSSVMSR